MKVIYNNAEVSYNTRNYATLTNKPSLNGVTLQGNVSLDTLQLYDKPTTKKLVDATSQIRLVTSMPADPEPSMTYYVGPDERQLYDVILVNDAKQQIHMGTTQFGQYKSGPGVNVKFDNTININTDDVSMYIDSEGNLASSLDGDTLPAFTGATASTAGTKGLVSKPLANDEIQVLRGDAEWVDLSDIIHPIGNVYITYDSSTNPNTLFKGQVWRKLDAGYLLRNSSIGGLAHPIVGVPDIRGDINLRPALFMVGSDTRTNDYGAWTAGPNNIEAGGYSGSHSSQLWTASVRFDASKSSTVAANIYKNFDSVQAPSIDVVVWRRTA